MNKMFLLTVFLSVALASYAVSHKVKEWRAAHPMVACLSPPCGSEVSVIKYNFYDDRRDAIKDMNQLVEPKLWKLVEEPVQQVKVGTKQVKVVEERLVEVDDNRWE